MPTPRLLGLLLGAAPLVALGTLDPGALLLAGAYLVGVLGVTVAEARTAPGASAFVVARRHERHLSLGDDNPVDVTVRWIGRQAAADRPRRLHVRDETPVGIPVDEPLFADRLAPGGDWTGRYHLRPVRRGDYTFGRVVLRVETRLGLLLRQHAYPETVSAVQVYPNLRALHRYELMLRRGRIQDAGLRRSRLRGQGTEFERLRDYQPDDDYRRIAWTATARRRQPVTIDYETERSQNLVLLLDTGRLMGAPIEAMEKLDHAVNAALMLAYVAGRLGDRVGMLTFADRVDTFVPPGRGRRQYLRLLDALYRVQAQPVAPDPLRALAHLAVRQRRRSLIVLFTDVADAAEADALVMALAHVARRHLAVCVTMSDPDVVALAEATPDDAQASYERVVARRLLDERRLLLDRLEHQGVLTVDVAADRLTAATVDRYLEVKARTRL